MNPLGTSAPLAGSIIRHCPFCLVTHGVTKSVTIFSTVLISKLRLLSFSKQILMNNMPDFGIMYK